MKRWASLPFAILIAGCVKTPLGYLDSSGSRAADTLLVLGWGFAAISSLVVLIIAALIGIAIRRSRRKAHAPDERGRIGQETGGVSAIYWGVGLSIPVLVAMAVWTFLSVQTIARPPRTPGLAVTVTGHRWWWQFDYQSPSDAYGNVSAANELVIPGGCAGAARPDQRRRHP